MAFIRISDIRPLVSAKAGRVYTGTADSSNNTTTLMRDADLGGYPNDFFNRLWFIVTSGTNNGTIRYIDDFVQSTGGVSWLTALPNAAQQSITYEIHQYDPTWVYDAVGDAIRSLFPSLAREVFCPIGVGGSPIANPSFEFYTAGSATPDGWTLNTATATRLSTNVFRSPYAIQLGTAAGNLSSATGIYSDQLREVMNTSVTLKCLARTAASSNARANLLVSGTNNYTDYATNANTWQTLSKTVSLTANEGAITIQLLNDTTSAAAFDLVWLETAGAHTLYIPAGLFPNGPARLLVEMGDPDDPDGGKLNPITGWHYSRNDAVTSDIAWEKIHLDFPSMYNGRTIWVKGSAVLSMPTSQTDATTYIEITSDEERLLVCEAAVILLDRVKGASPSSAHEAITQKQISILREKRALMDGFSSFASSADLPLGFR